MASAQLGPLLRLRGLPSSSLPAATASPDELAPFIISLLSEALPFVDSVEPKVLPIVNAMVEPPKSPWKLKATKKYPESDAPVDLMERTINLSELERIQRRFSASAATGSWGSSEAGIDSGGEATGYTDSGRLKEELWVCRRSVHRDSAEPGTANWAEFRTAFRDHHAETELASTAEVVAIREAICYEHAPELRVSVEGEGEWKVVAMKVLESRHHIPAPLGDRCFAGLQVVVQGLESSRDVRDSYSSGHQRRQGEEAGEERESKEFVVIHVSLRDFAQHDKAELAKSKGVVKAAFTSVERVRKMEGMGDVEWIMALSSDAKGVLPAWVQAMAVPGQIAKDVPLFFGWIARERETPGSGSGNFVGEKGEKRREREARERERLREREERKYRKSLMVLEKKQMKRESAAVGGGGRAGVGGTERTINLVKRKSMDFIWRRSERRDGVEQQQQDPPVPPLPTNIDVAGSGEGGGKSEGRKFVAAAA